MQRYEKHTVKRRSYTGTDRAYTEHLLTFDSFSEFIRNCHARKAAGSKNDGFVGASFYDTFAGATYPEAYKLASEGYPDGVKLLKMKLESLDVASHVKKPELYFDVCGDYGFDMALVCSGEPENAVCFRETPDESNTGPIINILVNTVMSGGIPLDVIAHRGAAIVSLIDALEQTRKRVQLDVICCADVAGELYTHRFPLKNASESLQLDQIAFALAHPAIERRFNFIALDLFPTWKTSMGYGSPIDADATAYDVYVPRLGYHDKDWQSIESVNAWVTKKLHALGITLDTDGDNAR